MRTGICRRDFPETTGHFGRARVSRLGSAIEKAETFSIESPCEKARIDQKTATSVERVVSRST